MAKNINVNLTFTANTQQAQQGLRTLQNQLHTLSTNALNVTGMSEYTKEIMRATNAASKLSSMLQVATNPETGTLNLNKFSQAIKMSGKDLSFYRDQLVSLGSTGEQAFLQLARSVVQAQTPLMASSTLINKMWTTMANTARWMISSSVLQGVTSTFSTAFDYAKDLNESLNNIRIVTGKSADQMDRFAVTANKAAKALSTSTTAYTDAALIYYQQGLNDKEVEERTNATIKLANVTRESASTVSEWMTAIWNNFDNGTKSLEYYADVLTALGAATASSADEIAGGLEKFAAIADTVGLSYEYAASALATITAQTRQSEDVVGTGLKTIFARIQDLELGKTAEDGTTLGQYSQALEKIGVSILDANGGLKDMDLILNEMGAKWDTLSKAQQTATAQSVAGIRQYSQLIALMDNWDKFSFNAQIASNAEGSLSSQAEIYAESWEASSKRVKAAAESLYSSLINDDFFITLNDGTSKLLTGLGEVIESMGGIKGLLPLLVSGMLGLFGPKMLTMVRNFSDQLTLTGRKGLEAAMAFKQEMINTAANTSFAKSTFSSQAQYEGLQAENNLRNMALGAERELTQLEQEQLTIAISTLNTLEEQAVLAGKEADQAKKTTNELKAQMPLLRDKVKTLQTTMTNEGYTLSGANQTAFNKTINKYANKGIMPTNKALTELAQKFNVNEAEAADLKVRIKELIAAKIELAQTSKKVKTSKEELITATNNYTRASRNLNNAAAKSKEELEGLGKLKIGDQFMRGVQGVSSLTFALSSLSSAFDTIHNAIENDTFTFQDFLNVLMSVSMAIPMIASGFKALSGAIGANTIKLGANTGAEIVNKVVKGANATTTDHAEQESYERSAALALEKKRLHELNEEELKNLGLKKLNGNTYSNSSGQTFSKFTSVKTAQQSSPSTQTPKISFKEKFSNFKSSAGNFIKTAGPSIAVAAVAIAAIVGGLVLMNNFINKNEKALKSATKNAEAAKKQYEDITNAVTEFQNKAKGYKESIDNISKLTKGTLEYKKALLEANQQAIDLINSSKTLQQSPDAYKVVDGRIIIDEDALEAAENEKLDEQTQQFLSFQNAEQIRREAQQTREEEKMLRRTKEGVGDYNESSHWGIAGGVGAATAGLIGIGAANVWNPVGWAALIAGAAVVAGSAIYGATVGDVEANEQAALEDLQEQFGEQGGVSEKELETFFENNPQYKGLQESFTKNIDGINELIRSNEALRIQNEVLEQSIADSIEDKYADKYEYDDRISGGVAEIIKQEREDKADEIQDLYGKIKGQDGLLQDLYSFLHEGSSLDEMAGFEIKIVDASGNTTAVQQDTVAKQMAEDIAVAVQTGDENYIKNLKNVIENAKGVSKANKEYLTNLVDQLVIDAGVEAKISDLTTQLGILDSTTAFAGTKNNSATHDVITQLAKDELEEIDFSGLTREQIVELQNIKTQFSDDIQKKIDQGLATYETRRRENDLKTSITYNVTEDREERLQAQATKAAVNATELIAYEEMIVSTYGVVEEQAERIALANLTVKNGLTDLMATFKKYGSSLDKSKKGTLEYSRGIAALQTNFEKWFGVKIDTDIVEANLENFKKALNGDKEAIVELQKVAAQEIIVKLDLDTKSAQQIQALLAEFNQEEITIGVSLNTSKAASQMAALYNEYIQTGQMSSEEAVRSLEAMGWDVATTTGTVSSDAPNYAGEEVEIINLLRTTYQGIAETLFDYMPEDLEKQKKEFERKFKNLEREKKLYTDIDALIKEINHSLTETEKKKERAFGKDKLKYIQQEKAYLEQSLAAQKEYLKQVEETAKRRFKNVDNYGFSFSKETGRILNYDEVWDNMYARYKAGYKAAGGDETLEKRWDEWWEDFENNTKLYNETIELRFDTQEAISDLQNQLSDADYEELEYKIELKTKINDSELKKIEFSLKRIEDNAYAAADAITLLGEKANVNLSNFNNNEQGMRDLLSYKGASSDQIKAFMEGDASVLFNLEFNQQDFELLQQYQDGMIDSYDQLKESFDGIFEAMDGVFKKINEEFTELDATLEHSQSVLKSYQNIIELAGASTLGITDAMQLDITDSQLSITQELITSNKAQYDKNIEMLAKARQGLADAEETGNMDLINKWKESIKTYEEQVRQSEQDWLSALANGLELSNQRRKQSIDMAIKEFLKETTGYNSMDELQKIYDQQKQLRDLYVTDYEKAYSLSKLSRQLDKSINDTNNINAKKQLLALEEKINKAKEAGVKMSSYELQNLEREYQIELAKIALAEAQNAKSIVRLQRNTEGGMSYVYTADQSAVDEAQQKYEDAIYASQKANDEWLGSAEEGLMQATATYVEQMAVINTATYDSVEERNEAIAALNEWYLSQQKFYTEQIDIVLKNNSDLYDRHVQTMDRYYDTNEINFIDMSKAMKKSGGGFIDDFKSTFVGGLDLGTQEAEDFYTRLVDAVGSKENPKTLLGKLQKAQDQWEKDTEKNFNNAGLNIDKFREHVEAYLGDGEEGKLGVKKIIENVTGAINTLTKKTNFSAAQTAATTYATEVGNTMKTAATEIGNVNTALQNLLDWWSKVEGLENKKLAVEVASPINTENNNQGPGSGKNDGLTFTLDENAMFDIGASVGHDGYHLGVISHLRQNDNQEYEYQVYGSNHWYNESDLSLMDDPQKWRSGTEVFLKDEPQITGRVVSDLGKEVQISSNGKTRVVDQSQLIKDNRPTSYTFNSKTRDDASWWSSYDENGNYKSASYHTNGDYIIDGISSNTVTLSDTGKKSYLFRVKHSYSDTNEYGQTSSGTTIFYMSTGALNQILGLEGKTAKEGILLHYNFPKFDTGGYTGEWGPEGRLAMLHQKEIVLNAHDTENILSVVDMVRQMAAQLDFNALAMAHGLGSLVANTMVATPQTIDQNVTITAEFPNATNKEEIKEAFGDLVNLAAQYASRK